MEEQQTPINGSICYNAILGNDGLTILTCLE